MLAQWFVLGALVLILFLFVYGRWRYDLVALFALFIIVAAGIIPGDKAFVGFGHPAVITVAAVLVVSRGLMNSGLVDYICRVLFRVGDRPSSQVATLTGMISLFSGFMNNIGALALLMPVAIRMARKSGNAPSLILMPMAFASLLGGLLTLIGTPPNIIISSYRMQGLSAEPFQMFDFMPVGLGVAIFGVLFISLVGWRLMPNRRGQASPEERFEIQDYLTEIVVTEKSSIEGKRLRELESSVEAEILVVKMVRGQQKFSAPSPHRTLKAGDILVIKSDSEDLKSLLDATGVELAQSKELAEETLGSDEISIVEAVIMPNSPLDGRTASSLNLRQRYGVNLLAIARQGGRTRTRLAKVRLRAGDVLLLQGVDETLQSILPELGLLPLAERGLQLGKSNKIILALGIFFTALIIAAIGLFPIQIAFAGAAFGMVLAGLLTVKEAYESIDWPIIVLLGAMIPVSQALESTGGAQTIAVALLAASTMMQPAAILVILQGVTMLLSNLVNNAAAAVLMAPIALNVAQGLGVSADPFLMSVAVGASCAFLTPIGHQSNTLVMGPGGYKFGDYWRMGLPLSIIVLIVSIPLILLFWPL